MARRTRQLARRLGAGLVILVCAAAAAWGGAALWQAATRPAETRVPTTRDCDDGDPCTIDFWHEFRDQCVHAADPLCTRTCAADTDCAFDPEVAPCIVGTCAEGQCSFVELAAADCQTCAVDADCPTDFCSPVTCTDGRCRHGERDCDDGDPSTWDRCSVEAQACEHLLADGVRSCAVPEDCASDHPCERFDCVAGRCAVTADTTGCGDALDLVRVCDPSNGNRECIQAGGDVCVAGPCEDGFCRWREVENATDCTYCEGDHQCDGSFCNWPVCTGTVCVVEEVPFCQDRNPATDDACSDELKTCLHPWTETPPRCTRPPTDDGNPDTVDLCDPATGDSVHLPAGDGPCATANLCFHGYEGPDGFCLVEAVTCLDDDACPARCEPDVGCIVDDAEICPCEGDGDCDLGSPCARTICMGVEEGEAQGVGGACWGTLIDGCVPCAQDGDCRVDDWCIEGTCSAEGYCDYRTLVTCDDGDPSTTGFCHGHKDETCSHEHLGRTPEGQLRGQGCETP